MMRNDTSGSSGSGMVPVMRNASGSSGSGMVPGPMHKVGMNKRDDDDESHPVNTQSLRPKKGKRHNCATDKCVTDKMLRRDEDGNILPNPCIYSR
jgi:hypothetical protein